MASHNKHRVLHDPHLETISYLTSLSSAPSLITLHGQCVSPPTPPYGHCQQHFLEQWPSHTFIAPFTAIPVATANL